jgi:hypothetical protein
MYESSQVLVWQAFVGGIGFIALLLVALALIWRWAAPSADSSATPTA